MSTSNYTHIIYRTTNLVTGKIYVGKHTTQNIDDGYLGSGNVILNSIKKHGKENFSRVILHTCETADEAYIAESKIVTPEFVARQDTYNQREGGLGGVTCTDETKAKMSAAKIGNTNTLGYKHTDKTRRRMAKAKTGRTLSASHKASMSLAAKKRWANTA